MSDRREAPLEDAPQHGAILSAVTDDPACLAIGALAIDALLREAALSPKPGLVTPDDAGAHTDMDYPLMVRSINGLHPFFSAAAEQGAVGTAFGRLEELGRSAETLMLSLTGGVNTVRGGIFNLGLLSAAAGLASAVGKPVDPVTVCSIVSAAWGDSVLAAMAAHPTGHTSITYRRYGFGGARQEAAAGFPCAVEVGVPAYRAELARSGDVRRASVRALFEIMAVLDDTAVLWRGGLDGLGFVQREAQRFLDADATDDPEWEQLVRNIGDAFVERNLSPGGSADTLAVTLFLDGLESLDL